MYFKSVSKSIRQKVVTQIENASLKTLRKAIVMIIFIFVWGLMTHEKISGSGDEPHYMMICHTLVFDGDLDLSNNYSDKNNLIFDGNLKLEEAHAKRGRGGHLYPSHDIGMPLLFAPYYFIAYTASDFLSRRLPPEWMKKIKMDGWGMLKALLGFAMVSLTGLLAVLIFDLCFYLTQKKAASFFWSILAAISPPILSHSYLFFTEILTALTALYIYKKFKMGDFKTSSGIFILGFLAGYLFLIHARNIGICAVLVPMAFYKIIHETRWRSLLFSFAAGAFIPVLFRTAMNRYFWESFVTTSHLLLNSNSSFQINALLKELTLRSFAILFDQEGGLLIYAPVYLYSICGLKICWKQSRETFYEVFLMVAFNYLLIVSFPLWNHHGWSGFWSPAGRYLVPLIPFLAVGTFYLFHSLRGFPVSLKSVLFLQISINLFFWQFPKLLWNGGQGQSAFLSFLSTESFNLVPLLPVWNRFSLHALTFSLALAGLSLWLNFSLLKKFHEQNTA